MHFIISNVHVGSRAEYIQNKLQLSIESVLGEKRLLGSDFVAEQVAAVADLVMPAISLTQESDFYSIDHKQEFRIAVATECALMEQTLAVPFLENEVLVENFFTYLQEPFEHFPRGTGVLKQRTNMADLLFIFDNVRIEDGNIIYRGSDQEGNSSEAVAARLEISTTKIMEILNGLLGKAAEAAGGEIGALIFNLVIKTVFGIDDDAKFIAAVQKVIREEIDSNEIDKINGHIQGTVHYLTNDYQVRRAQSDLTNPEERKELLNSLEQYSRQFYTEVMGVLEQPRYHEKGLQSYMLGASIHLIITQEMALVDWKTMNPNQSSYAATLRINAKHYRDHIETVFDNMVDTRLAKIVWDHMPDYACSGKTGCHISRDAWGWGDSVTHEGEKFYNDQHKEGTSAKDLAKKAAARQRTKIYNQIAENAADPRNNVIPHLKRLETIKFPV